MIAAPRLETTPSLATPALRPDRGTGQLVRLFYLAWLVLGDVAGVASAFVAGYELRFLTEPRPTLIAPLTDYFPTIGFFIGTLLVTFALSHLYLPRRGGSIVDRGATLFKAITTGIVVAMALQAFSLRGLDFPRNMLVYGWLLSILFVWLCRTVFDTLLKVARRAGLDTERVVIIGAGEDGDAIWHKICSDASLGYEVVGFVDSRPHAPEGPSVLGSLSDLPAILHTYQVRQVIVADLRLSHAQVLDVVTVCDRAHTSVQVMPDVFQLVVREVSASEFGGLPMLRVRDVSLRGWNLQIKRAVDVVGAAILLVLLAPVLLFIALVVKLSSAGPVFFVQERVGIDGRPFLCVKFRSMRVDAEAEGIPRMAVPGDDRTTAIGRWLRHYSLDELPQLVNVLLGDMSLVGPRPERPYFVEQFSRLIPRYEMRHQEKAGVTGWAQVNGMRGQTSIEERTRYDLFYVEHWSPAFDLKILLKTIAAVVRGRNAY